MIGGDDGSCNLSSVEFYNPATDKWSLIPTNMSNGRSYAGRSHRRRYLYSRDRMGTFDMFVILFCPSCSHRFRCRSDRQAVMTASAPRQQSAPETLPLMCGNRKRPQSSVNTITSMLLFFSGVQTQTWLFFSLPRTFPFLILTFEDAVALDNEQQPQDSGLFQKPST